MPHAKLTSPRFLLPLMMGVSLFVLGLHLNEAWSTLQSGALFSSVALAQTKESAPNPIQTEVPGGKASPQPAAPKQEAPKAAATDEALPSSPLPHEDEDSPESALYKQLAGRRDQLDKRAKELDDREALLKVAEQRVDQKLKEMETLRTQIQTLLGQANAAQAAQLDNLVKIYEIMKPKEAAKIFETLEMSILLGVVQKMKPARTAAILAEMDPQKAKDITTALTHQNQLPQIK